MQVKSLKSQMDKVIKFLLTKLRLITYTYSSVRVTGHISIKHHQVHYKLHPRTTQQGKRQRTRRRTQSIGSSANVLQIQP